MSSQLVAPKGESYRGSANSMAVSIPCEGLPTALGITLCLPANSTQAAFLNSFCVWDATDITNAAVEE